MLFISYVFLSTSLSPPGSPPSSRRARSLGTKNAHDKLSLLLKRPECTRTESPGSIRQPCHSGALKHQAFVLITVQHPNEPGVGEKAGGNKSGLYLFKASNGDSL